MRPNPEKESPMTVQNDQKSLTVGPSEQQGQTTQRTFPEAGISPRRRPSVLGFGITPHDFFSSNPFSLMRRMTEEMDRVMQEFGLERGGDNRTGWSLPGCVAYSSPHRHEWRPAASGSRPRDRREADFRSRRKNFKSAMQRPTSVTRAQFSLFLALANCCSN
jgi:hypothetical protein